MIIKEDEITVRTIKTKTIKKLMDKRLSELTLKLNVDPTLIDDFTTDSMLDTYRKVIDAIQKVEKTGRQKLYLVTGGYPFLWAPINVNTSINIIYWCKFFEKDNFYERPSIFVSKRIPRHYLLLYSFGRKFSPIKDTDCDLLFAIPNEIPKITVNFLPVFKEGETVFVRKDKLNLVEN
jgi:hypothetical protein